MQLVKITSQGQISIPSTLRAKYGLKANSTAFISDNNGKLQIEPTTDILSLAGVMKDRAIKGKTIEQIMAIEKRVVRNRWADRVKKWTSK